MAFNLAGDADFERDLPPYQPAKLYYHTISKRFLRFAVGFLRLIGKNPSRWGRNEDIDLTKLIVDFPVHAKITYSSVEKRKEAASYCHASQIGPSITGGAFRWIYKLLGFGSKDIFMKASPPPNPDGEKIELDLFEGV